MYDLFNIKMFSSLPQFQRYSTIPLDSENASRAFNSSYTSLDWPNFRVGGIKTLKNIQGFKVLSAQINATWYNINTKNNTFLLTEAGQNAATVTIPVGNYTSVDIVSALAGALMAASPLVHTYVVTLDSVTQKLTIVNNQILGTLPFKFTFGTILDTGSSNPRKLLGFDAFETSSSFWDNTLGDYLYASDVLNITGSNYLYVNSHTLGNRVSMFLPRDAADLKGGNAGPQIAKIPINVNPWGTIIWADPHPQYLYNFENKSDVQDFDIYLTLGNSNEPLELNGGVISLEIGIIENLDAGNNFSAGLNQIAGPVRAL